MVPTTAFLLIAHGSRHETANDDTRHWANELVRCGACPLAVAAFLELAEPSIDEGARQCVARGATQIIMLPHFLSEGVHVRRDLTKAMERLRGQYPGVDIRLAEPIGRHPLLLNILVSRAEQAQLS